ncbi:unnamed protein product [Rhizopus stolonifer]
MTSKHHSVFSFHKSTDDVFNKRFSSSPPTGHSFKQRMSSLLTPVNSLKETFHKKRKSWIEKEEDIVTHPYDTESSPSLSDSSSEEHLLTPPTTPSMMCFSPRELDSGLAYQVKTILGSIMKEVDDELENEWEEAREDLQKLLKQDTTFTITL